MYFSFQGQQGFWKYSCEIMHVIKKYLAKKGVFLFKVFQVRTTFGNIGFSRTFLNVEFRILKCPEVLCSYRPALPIRLVLALAVLVPAIGCQFLLEHDKIKKISIIYFTN